MKNETALVKQNNSFSWNQIISYPTIARNPKKKKKLLNKNKLANDINNNISKL